MAHRKGFFYRFRIPFRILGILLVFALAAALGLFLAKLGPRKVSDSELAELNLSASQVAEIVAEAEDLDEQYDAIEKLRKPTEEDLALLRGAQDKLVEALDAAGGSNAEIRIALDKARQRFQNAMAEKLYEESQRLEVEIAGVSANDPKARIKLYTQAIALQEEINKDYAMSNRRDIGRQTRLERERGMLQAKPLYEKSIAAQEEAELAIEAQDWDAAGIALERAIDSQKTLNMEFRGLKYADLNRLSELEVDLVSLKSGRIYDRIKELEEAGDEALEAGNYRESAGVYVKAERLQQQLNRDFPGSRFASSQRVEDFQTLQETALGSELAKEIKTELGMLDKSLRGRNVWEASDQIQNLNQKIKQFSETYPRNTTITDEEKVKLQFLEFVQNDLALLQDRIYGQLILIPDSNDWHLLRTEVSQALFTSIMLSNPSRRKGELFPVDSITWDEAKDFCQKASWLLARPVRLPTQAEFSVSIGPLRYVNLDSVSWNQQNSGGVTHEVGTKEANAAGYHDLLGNVAEWLESDSLPGDSEGFLAGGSAETSIDALVDKPIEILNRRTRNRLNGFRIAVRIEE
ncbi:SUMF1/EgtB/PvdO family nonheme iron enzyme [Rubellicoccus peritrichatus]|uniref:SUMF1/EgtB/PvdO family nonheme iron enzyme n=1 Tax=Rubellicoccus peritrichatus TaxID=3080537 RepID=A0AAQ3QV00_9BACT|nr:SUMF1/EgtB/PvdO family nonheme iron enzyme [Puniceicoccus sp. CR14]WOO42946.1 SUMF1/EgtB/PvdO family nonheme iron enzyme [Puniceicoccus sp. CR14]